MYLESQLLTTRRIASDYTRYPEGPSAQYVRTLVPKTIHLIAFGTKLLKYSVLGPSGVRKAYVKSFLGIFLPLTSYTPPKQPRLSGCRLPNRAHQGPFVFYWGLLGLQCKDLRNLCYNFLS